MNERLVEVVLPLLLPGPLTYRLPAELSDKARPGMRVLVPLGNRRQIGCLLGETSQRPPGTLKEVCGLLDETPILLPHQLKLLTWASEYYLTPIGEVLRHLLPPRLLKGRKK